MDIDKVNKIRQRARMNVIYHQKMRKRWRLFEYAMKFSLIFFVCTFVLSLYWDHSIVMYASLIMTLMLSAYTSSTDFFNEQSKHRDLAIKYIECFQKVDWIISLNMLDSIEAINNIVREMNSIELLEAKIEGIANKSVLMQAFKQTCEESHKQEKKQ